MDMVQDEIDRRWEEDGVDIADCKMKESNVSVKDLLIKEAIVRAELETLEEMHIQLYERYNTITGNYAEDVVRFNEMIQAHEEALAKLQESKTSLAEKTVTKVKDIMTKQIGALESDLNEKKVKIDTLSEEIEKLKVNADNLLKASNDTLHRVKVEHKAKVEEMQKKHEAEMEKVKVLEYINCQLEFSGLALPEQARALLEKCSSKEMAAELIERFKDAMRESASYSGDLSGVTVDSEGTMPPELQRVMHSISTAFQGMGIK